jgi:amino acid adenylation domain-containing protein
MGRRGGNNPESEDQAMSRRSIGWPDRIPTIHERFSHVAAERADHIAVTDRARQITFAELDARSLGLASRIATSGRAGTPVAVLADHGIDTVIAMLAAVRAGRPFTVIDPATPASRILQIAEDVLADTFVATAPRIEMAEQLAYGDARVIGTHQEPGAGQSQLPDAHRVAGVFYTSGSTGEPKGVMRSQEGIVRRVRYEQELAGLGPGDCLSLLYSCSYGASQNDTWSALLSGARLALYPVAAEGVGKLATWIDDEAITWLHVPIALLRQVMDTVAPGHQFDCLRVVLPSGRLFGSDIDAVRTKVSSEALIYSQFASSETSIGARLVIEPHQAFGSGEVIPVGYDAPGVRIAIVDEAGDEVSSGQEGQLVVTSPMLSLGYWNKPSETNAAFGPDPLQPGLRRFTSGDFGWRDDQGRLHFVGRRDDRVKLRGYRVELNEVAHHVRQLPNVHDAHVRIDPTNPDRLVAYVVGAAGARLDTAELRRALAARVPSHEIPSVFVGLDELPLTANGKLDTDRLPSPDRQPPETLAELTRPRSPTEWTIAEIWQEALGLDQVGVFDTFAQLGGDSLAAMRVVARVVEQCDTEIALRQLLEQATVASMASLVDSPAPSGTAPLPRAVGDSHALSHQQQNLWLSEEIHHDGTLNMVRLLDLDGPLDVPSLSRAVDELVQRHEPLRTIYPFEGEQLTQRVLPSSGRTLRVHDLSSMAFEDAQARIEEAVAAHQRRSFRLRDEPSWHAELFVVDSRQHTLALIGHHIASDRISSTIVFEDLVCLYLAERGLGPPPHPLPARYVDYVAWQQDRLSGEVLEATMDRWRSRLLPPAPDLVPLVRPERDDTAPPAVTKRWEVEAPTGDLVVALAREERTTPFVVVMACLKAAIADVVRADDILVTTILSGRDRAELERMVGCFVTMLPIRSRAPAEPTLRRFVQAEREATLDALADREVPFEALVSALKPSRARGRTPFADITLNFADPTVDRFEFGDVSGRRRPGRVTGEVTFAVRATISESALRGDLTVDPAWIELPVAHQVLERFALLANKAVRSPDRIINR